MLISLMYCLIASTARGLGPRAFSFDPSLITWSRLMPYASATSSADLPGIYVDGTFNHSNSRCNLLFCDDQRGHES